MKFKIIACINEKNALGLNGDLLYHIGNDLKNFKRLTIGGVVIMGRKTFESIGSKPLSDRVNIILTNDKEYSIDADMDNVFIFHNIDEAIDMCETLYNDKECYVIGGASLYKAFLDEDLVDMMYITEVNDDKEGDTYFPDVLPTWRLKYQSMTQRQRLDETTYKFSIYVKP